MRVLSAFFIVGLFTLMSACNSNVQKHQRTEGISKIQIGISKASGSKGYLKYGEWLNKIDSSIQYYDLYNISKDSALKVLAFCDGLLISGGPDVEPKRYGEVYDSNRCESTDPKRDSLEFALIDLALNQKMPILGICRGEQILNVYFGGSLYQDIPTDVPENVGHRFSNIDSSYHVLNIVPNELLAQISGVEIGNVNSSHHQAVKKLGNDLMVLARTNDEIVESITWKNPKGKSFLLGIQWHPEWLAFDNPLSSKVGQRFYSETKKYHQLKQQNND